MRDPMRVFWLLKHAMGVALLVHYWPSRRMIRRQAAEIARLRRGAILRAVEPEPVAQPTVDMVPLVTAVQDTLSAVQGIAEQVTPASTENWPRLRAVP